MYFKGALDIIGVKRNVPNDLLNSKGISQTMLYRIYQSLSYTAKVHSYIAQHPVRQTVQSFTLHPPTQTY